MAATQPTPRPEAAAKADAILDAAQRLFARFGFRRTAVEDIALEAGVAKGTVYLYFAGKEAVFRAVQRRTTARIAAACEAALAGGGDFAGRLRRLVHAQFADAFAIYGQSEHLSELVRARTTVGEDIAREGDAAARTRFMSLLRAAARDGEVITDDSLHAAVVETVFAAALGAKTQDGAPVSAQVFGARLDALAQVAAAALRPPSAAR